MYNQTLMTPTAYISGKTPYFYTIITMINNVLVIGLVNMKVKERTLNLSLMSLYIAFIINLMKE